MIEPDELLRVANGRWTMPLLALASQRKGLRFAEVVRTLGIARTVARRTLDELIAAGWLVRNPGHGHPLRPDYALAGRGIPIGAWCAGVVAVRSALGLALGDLTRWTTPAIAAIAAGHERFSDLADRLAPVSPRALSMTLKAALASDLIERRLEPGFPPTPRYSLTARGRTLAAALT